MKAIKAAILAFALTGCASVEPAPVIIPASLLVPCDAPVALPSRDLTFTEVEVMWGRDRSALRTCSDRHAGLAAVNGP
jgi:hypothetical protein